MAVVVVVVVVVVAVVVVAVVVLVVVPAPHWRQEYLLNWMMFYFFLWDHLHFQKEQLGSITTLFLCF